MSVSVPPPVLRDAPIVKIGRVRIIAATRVEAVRRLIAIVAEGGHQKLAFANAHVVNLAANEPDFAQALGNFWVLPDGIGVDLGARLLSGQSFPANLNGTDFIPHLLSEAPAGWRVALLGGRPGVADRAASALRALRPDIHFQALGHGFMPAREETKMLDALAEERPDLLLVAMGNPRQELWIQSHIQPRHCGIAAGVGALFDFLGGEVPRAPLWVREVRLEWVFRLAQEPNRLWRRYMLGNPMFLARIMAQLLRGRRT